MADLTARRIVTTFRGFLSEKFGTFSISLGLRVDPTGDLLFTETGENISLEGQDRLVPVLTARRTNVKMISRLKE